MQWLVSVGLQHKERQQQAAHRDNRVPGKAQKHQARKKAG